MPEARPAYGHIEGAPSVAASSRRAHRGLCFDVWRKAGRPALAWDADKVAILRATQRDIDITVAPPGEQGHHAGHGNLVAFFAARNLFHDQSTGEYDLMESDFLCHGAVDIALH